MKIYIISVGTAVLLQLSLMLPVAGQAKAENNPKKITLEIKGYKRDRPNDTLTLNLYDAFMAGDPMGKARTYQAIRDAKGKFYFDIEVEREYGFWELTAKMTQKALVNRDVRIFNPQFWEAGDSLQVAVYPDEKANGVYHNASISGKGSAKYMARYVLENIEYLKNDDSDLNRYITDQDYFASVTKNEKRRLDILDDFKGRMSSLSYELLKSDIYFERRAYVFQQLYPLLVNNSEEQKTLFADGLGKKHDLNIDPTALGISPWYLFFKYQELKMKSFLQTGRKDLSVRFNAICQSEPGSVRDAALISFFTFSRNTDSAATYFERARKLIIGKTYQRMLKELYVMVPGRVMPDYSFNDLNGKAVRLSDFNDKVVIIDTWSKGCGYCAVFYKNALSKVKKDFAGNSDIVVLSINTDTTISRWKEGIATGKLTGPGAVNIYTSGKGGRHPFLTDNLLISLPSVVILGPGRVVKQFNNDSLYSYDGLLKATQEVLQKL